MNSSERVCVWCQGTPATDEGMTFATDDRNCPCNFCQTRLSKRRSTGSTTRGAAQPAFVRVRRNNQIVPRHNRND